MSDLLTRWNEVQERQRRLQRGVEECRVVKTAIIRACLDDGMTQEQAGHLLGVSTSTVQRLAELPAEYVPPRNKSGV